MAVNQTFGLFFAICCQKKNMQNCIKAVIAIVCKKIANDNFCMHCCNWQLLFALLLLTIFVCMTFSVCTIAIDTFLYALLYTLNTFIFTIANDYSFHMYYSHNCNWQLLYALSDTTTFVFTATFDNHNYQLFCALLQLNLHTLLQLRNPTSRRSETLTITTWITF